MLSTQICNYHIQASEHPTHKDFWCVKTFMRQFKSRCATLLTFLEKDGQLQSEAQYDGSSMRKLRAVSAVALRLVLLGRNIDVWEIRTWKWDPPNDRYLEYCGCSPAGRRNAGIGFQSFPAKTPHQSAQYVFSDCTFGSYNPHPVGTRRQS